MFRNILLAGLFALAAGLAVPAQAQTPLDFVRAGDYAGARALLKREVQGRPDAPLHLAFLEGVILEHEGRPKEAASLYRQILKIAPGFAPARKALAIVLANMGNQRAALYQAERLSATTTDARLRADLQQDIAAMGGAKRGGIALRFALLPSTNANHATSEQTVVIGGIPFVLTPASRQASGVGLTYGATAWHTWLLSESWLATGQLSFDHWAYDNKLIPRQSLATGRIDLNGTFGRAAVSFGPRIDRAWQDGARYRDRTGFGASASYGLTHRSNLELDLSYYRQVYPGQGYLDGHLITVTPGYSLRIAKGWTFGFGLPLVRETTRRDYLDHKDAGFQLSVGQATRYGLKSRLDLGYSVNHYGGIYPGMGVARRDKVVTVSFVISDERFQLGGMVPQFSVTRTIDMSNISIQSYQSTDFGISLVRQF